MDHIQVLNRAWRTVWSYRALWFFGVVVALVTFSWLPAAFLDADQEWEDRGIVITRLDGESFWEAIERTMREEVDEGNRELRELLDELGINVRVHILVTVAVLGAVMLTTYVAAKIARYVSETALVRMVGRYQEADERLSIKQGLRLGWSRHAWQLFLINLLTNLLTVLIVLAVFALILAPLPLWVDRSEGVIFTFAFLTAAVLLVAIAAVIVAAGLVSAWKRLSRQACALEGLGVTEAMGHGWRILWHHLRDVGFTWLITFGLHLGWSVAMVPAVLLLTAAGLLFGGLPGVVAGMLAGLTATGDAPVFVGLALGIPLFLLILTAPLIILGGLREAFISTLWTLTYSELQGLKRAESKPVPTADRSTLQAAPA